jgi:hypothetical protein
VAVGVSTLVLVVAGWAILLLGVVLVLTLLSRRRNPWHMRVDRRVGAPDRRGDVLDRRRGLPDPRELKVDRRRGASDRRIGPRERRRAFAAQP